MTCVTDSCCQGRKPCPTPATCNPPPLSSSDVGVECALPPELLGPGIEFAGREPIPWGKLALLAALLVAWLLSIYGR